MDKAQSLGNQLFRSLLQHVWLAREPGTPHLALIYPKGYLISSGQLIKLFGVPLNPKSAGGPPYDIVEYCLESKWPPLHSLVVRSQEGYPGEGYFHAPGTDTDDDADEARRLKEWNDDVERCMAFTGYPRIAPIMA